jgi:hypothetical protein
MLVSVLGCAFPSTVCLSPSTCRCIYSACLHLHWLFRIFASKPRLAAVLATFTTPRPPMSSPISKNDNAATAGLGTGLGIGVPLLATLCVSLWPLDRARKQIGALGSIHHSARSEFPRPGDPTKWQPTPEIDSRYVHEVPGSKP